MTQEQKDTLNKYAEIKADIKNLESKAEELNPQVLEIMQVQDVEELTLGDIGKLTLASRRTWKYSTATTAAEKALKETKKIEEQTGKADYTEKHYVIFKGNKENDHE